MIIKLTSKEDRELKYHFETHEENIVILNGFLYELSDDEVVKFYYGEYMKKFLKDAEEGYVLGGFDLGLYITNAPYCLEDYFLEIN